MLVFLHVVAALLAQFLQLVALLGSEDGVDLLLLFGMQRFHLLEVFLMHCTQFFLLFRGQFQGVGQALKVSCMVSVRALGGGQCAGAGSGDDADRLRDKGA